MNTIQGWTAHKNPSYVRNDLWPVSWQQQTGDVGKKENDVDIMPY